MVLPSREALMYFLGKEDFEAFEQVAQGSQQIDVPFLRKFLLFSGGAALHATAAQLVDPAPSASSHSSKVQV